MISHLIYLDGHEISHYSTDVQLYLHHIIDRKLCSMPAIAQTFKILADRILILLQIVFLILLILIYTALKFWRLAQTRLMMIMTILPQMNPTFNSVQQIINNIYNSVHSQHLL